MCCCLSCWRCSLVISGLPSRLYGAYQREWVFSSLMLTMIFAVYALATLLVVGRLSDSIGRKPGSARRRKASRAGRMPVPRGASRVEAAACMSRDCDDCEGMVVALLLVAVADANRVT